MLTLSIISPKSSEEFTNLVSVSLPAFKGVWNILPKHSEAFSVLTEGVIRITHEDSSTKEILISNGTCHVAHDVVRVIL